MTQQDHLARAKEYISIAESGDAKREAYKAAADEIVAYIEETGDNQRFVATNLAVSESKVSALVQWRKRGYDTDSPYDEGPEKRQQERARISHAKRVLHDPEQSRRVIAQLSAEERAEIAKHAMADSETRKQMRSDPDAERILNQHRDEAYDEARQRSDEHCRNQRTAREEHVEDPLATPFRLTMAELGGALLRIQAAAREVQEHEWTDEYVQALRARAARVSEAVDLFGLSLGGADDLDAQFAALLESES